MLEENNIIQLGYLPNRIDMITSLKGLVFEKCYSERIRVEIQGTLIDFIDIENLKTNKKATGRPQDLADLENLTAELTLTLLNTQKRHSTYPLVV